MVASNGVTLNHAGTGVPGAPLSTNNAKSVAVPLTEVTIMACVGGFGPLAGKIFRIGLMGPLATEENVQFFLAEFKKALKAEGYAG